MYSWFQTVDSDKSGQITAMELQQALTNGNWSHFNPETCRLMIGKYILLKSQQSLFSPGLFDQDNSGTIDLKEFQQLWTYINQWRGVFDRYDRDKSGNIDCNELFTGKSTLNHKTCYYDCVHVAYNEMGFRVSMQFCQMIVVRFDRLNKRSLKFDDFIQTCVMLRSLTDAFRARDTNLDGTIHVGYEDFMTMAISNKP